MDNKFYSDGILHVYCTECGHAEEIKCNAKTADAVINRRGLIQNLLPNVSADVREMFLSGWCGVCYDLGLMHFPKLAIEEINQFIKDTFRFDGNFLSDDFSVGCKSDITEFLQEMENYDGIYSEEVHNALIDLRKKISELANKIDRGDYDDEEY